MQGLARGREDFFLTGTAAGITGSTPRRMLPWGAANEDGVRPLAMADLVGLAASRALDESHIRAVF